MELFGFEFYPVCNFGRSVNFGLWGVKALIGGYDELHGILLNTYSTTHEQHLIIIIIKIRGQIENRSLENTRFAGRKWLLAGRYCINDPTADWFSVHHPMNINQSGYVYWRGKTIQVRTACVVNVCRLEISF